MAVVRSLITAGMQWCVVGVLLGTGIANADLAPAVPAQGGTGAQAAAKKTEADLAQEAFTSGNFGAAMDLLRKAVEKNSDLPPAHVIMANWYANVSNVNLGAMARNALEAAVVENAKDPEAYVILANIALNERRWTEGELLLAKAADCLDGFKGSKLRRERLEPQLLSGQASVNEAREKWALAQKSLEKLLELDAKNVGVLQRMAKALFLQDNYDEAFKKLQAAAQNDPNALNPHAQMALFYEAGRKPGAHEKAKNEMSLALKEDSKARTYLIAARWAVDVGEIEEAKRFAAKALTLAVDGEKGQALDAKMLLGVIAYVSRQWDKAEDYFQQVLNEMPANAMAANNLALALCEQEDPAKRSRAVQHALTIAQRAPKQAEAHSTLGWACFKAGNMQQAVASMQTAVQMGQVSRDTAYFAAEVFAAANAKDAARSLLEQALGPQAQGAFPRMQDAQALLAKLKK